MNIIGYYQAQEGLQFQHIINQFFQLTEYHKLILRDYNINFLETFLM